MFSRAGSLAQIASGLFACALVAVATASAAHAEDKVSKAAVVDIKPMVTDVKQAISEGRLIEAGRLLDLAAIRGMRDPQLDLLSGRLDLARNRPSDAINVVTSAENVTNLRAEALEVKGLALARLSRTPEAITTLTDAVALDDRLWRSWNVLGAQYDSLGKFAEAANAYEKAIAATGENQAILNNRGYSYLLQGQVEEAVADFVRALEKAPGSTTIRTNLRIALAARGDYARATAAGAGDDQAVLLNNAGFGAVLAGNYSEAERLFSKAQEAKGSYYEQAAVNGRLAAELASRSAAATEILK
jgi:Flp pilus assembly protein TadD